MRKNRPSFQFYPADFLADENVRLMNNQARGCYIMLLCHCWREGSIPSDIEELAALCGEDVEAMRVMWSRVGKCFTPKTKMNGRLVQRRLLKEKRKQDEYHKRKSDAGKKGAKARWDKELEQPKENDTANGSAIDVPMAKNCSSASTSASASSSSASSTARNKLFINAEDDDGRPR